MKPVIQKIIIKVREFFRKPFRWTAMFSVLLTFAVLLVFLDTFVIPHIGIVLSAEITPSSSMSSASSTGTESGTAAESDVSGNDSSSQATITPVITENSYQDENISIIITMVHKYDTTIYIADIRLSGVAYLKTAFAQNTFGRNIKQTTSAIAEESGAIFAINGDYYGFRDSGFVIRNGVLYRANGDNEALCIDGSGNLSIIDESSTDAKALIDAGVLQVLSFGPALIEDGQIKVTSNSEVGQSMNSNPRTAIGQISALHYICIVSDGRTTASAGLSLLQLAQELKDQGCTVAYNLDGGGSSTMWFNGQVVNVPANGKSSSERSVSDIVYIG